MARRSRRARWALAVVVTALAALAVWPVPSMWQGATITSQRLLLRPASAVIEPGKLTALDTPLRETMAATVFLGWREPVRLADSCLTRASVELPDGWVHQSTFVIPGQVAVPQQDRSRVVVEQAAGVERFFRPTFVRPEREVVVADLRANARIERVCDGKPTQALDLVLVVTPPN